MALYRISDLYHDYANQCFEGVEIKGLEVYGHDEDSTDQNFVKVGLVKDLLVDDQGCFRYFVVNTGFWLFGKTVILPVSRGRIAKNRDRLYAINLTKEQVENLPDYSEAQVIDDAYENLVSQAYATASVEDSVPVQQNVPVESAGAVDPGLKLYEERLVGQKHREKTGEVTITKRIETHTESVAVPVRKEKIVIEVTTPLTGAAATAAKDTFQEMEVANVDLYGETATAQKEIRVSEGITVRKEIEEEVVTLTDQVRHEELDIATEGSPTLQSR